MSFSMAGGSARGPEINVTPLIDVLLTLIIRCAADTDHCLHGRRVDGQRARRNSANPAAGSETDAEHSTAKHHRHS